MIIAFHSDLIRIEMMEHLTHIQDIEQKLMENRFCLFYIKAPDCGVCRVMLDKVTRMTDKYPQLCAFYTDITEEPLIAGQFLVYSDPTVLLFMEGKEMYRSSQFIDLQILEQKIRLFLEE